MENQPTNCNADDNMEKKPHVPKFGDWDSDNIQYTACFEKARKEKDGVKRNPNDPEDNPEAFKGMLANSLSPAPPNVTSSSTKSLHQAEGDIPVSAHRRHSILKDQHKTSTGSRKSHAPESGSEKSNSDHSLLQQQSRHRRERSDRRKSLVSSGSDHSTSHSHSRLKGAGSSHHSSNANIGHYAHTRVASIPKFGDWDEKDPQSGEGFTLIFDKVKEEKQIASKYPIRPQEPTNHLNKRGKSFSKSKICCCLFPSAKE